MKFMKLGSKVDVFQSDGNFIRYVSSDLATDVAITVGEVKFYLHKFPLLSKSSRLRKLILKADEDNSDEIDLVGFPGGPKAFDICAKFCYGMIVTLNAHNVVAARCAAEYLGMTEDVDRGNLISKIEVFLNSCIFRTWKDTILVLQTSKSLLPWSEDLKIVGRSIDSIASKTSVDPAKITWSYTYNRKLAMLDKIVDHENLESVPKDWWVEDICELDIDMYKRILVAIKSKGRMDGTLIGEALRTFAVRWLPDSIDTLTSDDHIWRNKSLVETIICLLPSDNKSLGCSCSFLLKLLKVAVLVEANDMAREGLVRKIGLKLDEASLKDLLIPARPPQITVYDVELVQSIVKRFVMQDKSCTDVDVYDKHEKSNHEIVLGAGSWLKVGGLVDVYLAEIASDPNLALSTFIELSSLVPDSARPIHDGLYRAIDIYLKEHPDLNKGEKKQICGLMDVQKLSMDASAHAAKNERLPLRVVVQVLYFEQVRSASGRQVLNSRSLNTSSSTPNEEDEEEEWDQRTLQSCKSLRKQMNAMKIQENEELQKFGNMLSKKKSRNSRSGVQLLPSRSRRIFDRLWGTGKGNGPESKSSETSGSSQSPTTSLAPGDAKSAGLSSRNRRHSIS